MPAFGEEASRLASSSERESPKDSSHVKGSRTSPYTSNTGGRSSAASTSHKAHQGSLPSPGGPYLSVVATSRNDEHGGNLLRRMQMFIDGLIAQCRRYGLDCELILVEWNPPQYRPRFAEALHWPAEPGPCVVRIIEVSGDIHARFRHSDRLPLFQMIAKNVGIRRARGRFVLATNVDILFSDELMARLARRGLADNVMYRVDRYDIPANIPLDGTTEERLAFAKRNVLRVNRRDGTVYPATGRLDRIYRPRSLVLIRALASPILAPIALILSTLIRLLIRRTDAGQLRRLSVLHRFIRIKMHRQRTKAVPATPIALRLLVAALRLYGRAIAEAWRAVGFELRRGRLHTNACGDFTLMSRERWLALCGYPELEMYSFHLDSLLCHAAVCSGVREKVFTSPARIYHIEHSEGSGFTPEGRDKLWNRMRTLAVPRLGDAEFWRAVIEMRQGKRRWLRNEPGWGLTEEPLVETWIGRASDSVGGTSWPALA
jgi:hypothetical protein